MHGADHRLAGERADRLHRIAGARRRQGRQDPQRSVSRRRARIRGPSGARRLRLCHRRSQGLVQRRGGLRRDADLSHHSLSEPGIARRPVGMGGADQLPGQGVREVTERREVWITGVGLLTCLGEGLEANWARLTSGEPPAYDDKSFAPYIVHQLAPMSFDKQIPKKSDQRQMETWQRVGVYTAGMALTDAGIAGNAELLDRTDMIVAAGGGERDTAVDTAIMAGVRKVNEPGAFLNERLMSDLRPTLFLAQLPNLLAGNISLVHGVVGSSRTFLGEEAAGVDAVRVAQARVAAGQSELTLVGGASHGARWDLLLIFALGGAPLKDKFAP